MLTERDLPADHTSVWRWVQRYAPELNKRCRRELKPTNGSWRVDETYSALSSARFRRVQVPPAFEVFYRVNYLVNDTPAAINLATQFPSSTRSAAALVQSVKVHFKMGNDPGDNKDWDTGLGIYLVNRANSVAGVLTEISAGHVRALATVPKGVNGEGSWQSGRDDIEVPLTIQGQLQWSDMSSLTLLITEDANGADHIGFTPTVIATGPSDTLYRSTLQAFSIPSIQPGFPLFFPGDFGQVTAVVPSPPAPACSAPTDFLRNSRAASSR